MATLNLADGTEPTVSSVKPEEGSEDPAQHTELTPDLKPVRSIGGVGKLFREMSLRDWIMLAGAVATWALLVSPLPFYARWIGLLVAFGNFAILASGGHREYKYELGRYLFEAILAAGLATGLVMVLAKDHGEVSPEHIVVGVALAIVLSGISILAKSSQTMERSSHRFAEAYAEMKQKLGGIEGQVQRIQSTADKSQSTAEKLDSALSSFNHEIGKAHLVSLAARAVTLRSSTLEYGPVQSAVDAALGTMRTWAEGSRNSFETVAEGDSNECGAAEATWWRSLEAYHNEERYDLARFEMVTNARNYAYILASTIDQLRSSAGLIPDENGTYPAGADEVVIVQCSTFSPKDFYNFPHGAKGFRRYRDLEFYGTYRRTVSFLNRHQGIYPHRIVLLADDSDEDRSPGVTAEELERLGWAVDTPAAMAMGSARLFCAPYSMPLPENPKDDGPPYFYRTGWAHANPEEEDRIQMSLHTGFGKNQVCPVVPVLDNPSPGDDDFDDWEGKARDHTAKILFRGKYSEIKKAKQEEVKAVLSTPAESINLPDVNLFLGKREEWAWTSLVVEAYRAIDAHATDEDSKPMKTAFDALEARRTELIDLLGDTGPADRGNRIGLLVRGLSSGSQAFDAFIEELKAKLNMSHDAGDSRWMNLRSMTGLQMGPGEAWLYHVLNRVSGVLFQGMGRSDKLTPVWNLFCWDFLGMDDADILEDLGREWADRMKERKRGVGSRIRFVKVAPGSRSDKQAVSDKGVISALGFESRGFQREFTLIGTRPATEFGKGADAFAGVRWALLLTCEIAPPFSTCRLNFHYPGRGGTEANLLNEYVRWIQEVWRNSEQSSAEIFERMNRELSRVTLPSAKQAR